MNGILAVFVLMLEASASCRDDQLLTGQWDVSENISHHQYEIEFSKPDIVELRFRGNVDVGTYHQECNETYASLKLSWPNGSDTLGWLQYGENGEIRTYQRFGQAAGWRSNCQRLFAPYPALEPYNSAVHHVFTRKVRGC